MIKLLLISINKNIYYVNLIILRIYCLTEYYSKLEENGYNKVIIPKYLINELKREILEDINHKFHPLKFKSFNLFGLFLKKLSNEIFIEKFGSNLSRILNAKTTKKINLWVEKNIPKKINSKKAALNIITSKEYRSNVNLKQNQFCAFYRVVRKNKKDVGHPHRDSSFWKLGNKRKTYFKHKIVWKLWIPISGVKRQNSLNMIHASHKDNIKMQVISRNGQKKPKISKEYILKNANRVIKPIKFDGSEGVLFHKDTVHFANINKSTDCRISIEFNILAN